MLWLCICEGTEQIQSDICDGGEKAPGQREGFFVAMHIKKKWRFSWVLSIKFKWINRRNGMALCCLLSEQVIFRQIRRYIIGAPYRSFFDIFMENSSYFDKIYENMWYIIEKKIFSEKYMRGFMYNCFVFDVFSCRMVKLEKFGKSYWQICKLVLRYSHQASALSFLLSAFYTM